MNDAYLRSVLNTSITQLYLHKAIARNRGGEFLKNFAIIFEAEQEKCVKLNTSPKECLKDILETVYEMTMTRSVQLNPLDHEQSK
jgi:hypothetical protein